MGLFLLIKDGFIGKLYIPDEDCFTGKVLIAFSGSDGVFLLSQKLAEKFQTVGLTIMALAYWNMPGLPDHLEDIPLEYLGMVSDKLKEMGYEKIGLWGVYMRKVSIPEAADVCHFLFRRMFLSL